MSSGKITVAQYEGWTDDGEWKQLEVERLLRKLLCIGGESLWDPEVSDKEER